jgi:hypothetical protein
LFQKMLLLAHFARIQVFVVYMVTLDAEGAIRVDGRIKLLHAATLSHIILLLN